MSLKIEFVEKAVRPGARMASLCREYGISRETGYKWVNRFKREGPDGLEERSRRPKSTPLATAAELVAAVLEAREAHPRRGPRKIFFMLQRKFGTQTPSVATIARILKRFGMVRQRSRYPRLSITERAPSRRASKCNEIWTVDFKGWWCTTEGERCEPLTVRDAHSRYILTVKLLASCSVDVVRRIFEKLFRKYGLPQAIQCDNGRPFINVQSRGGLTRLSAWWVSLGIEVIRSRPGCPQDNGAHERMHRDMSEDLQAFPEASLAAAQRACDRWRQDFNHVRPHDALGGRVPADVYHRSERMLRKVPYVYPSGWVTRTVTNMGLIWVGAVSIFVGKALARERVGLEPLGELEHRLWFRDLDLGTLQVPVPNLVIDAAVEQHLSRRAKKKAA